MVTSIRKHTLLHRPQGLNVISWSRPALRIYGASVVERTTTLSGLPAVRADVVVAASVPLRQWCCLVSVVVSGLRLRAV